MPIESFPAEKDWRRYGYVQYRCVSYIYINHFYLRNYPPLMSTEFQLLLPSSQCFCDVLAYSVTDRIGAIPSYHCGCCEQCFSIACPAPELEMGQRFRSGRVRYQGRVETWVNWIQCFDPVPTPHSHTTVTWLIATVRTVNVRQLSSYMHIFKHVMIKK